MTFKDQLVTIYQSSLLQSLLRVVHQVILKLGFNDFFASRGRNKWFFIFIPTHKRFSKKDLKLVSREGIKYRLNLSDYAQWMIYAGVKDHIRGLVKNWVREGGLLLDIGANAGQISLNAAHRAHIMRLQDFQCFAFEPNPYAVQVFRNNLELNEDLQKHITMIPKAVGAHGGFADLYFNPGHSGCGSLEIGDEFNSEIVKIPVCTVDDFISEQGLSHIDLMKIDVEGFEKSVLQGAEQTLKKHRPALIIEINRKMLQRHGSAPESLYEILRNLEYQLFMIVDESILLPKSSWQEEQELFDIIAIHEQDSLILDKFKIL